MTPDKLAAYRTLSQHGYGVSELGTPSPSSRPRVTIGFTIRDTSNSSTQIEKSNAKSERLPSPTLAAGAPVVDACAANSREEHSPSLAAAGAAGPASSPADEGAACCSPEVLSRTSSVTRGSSGILLVSTGGCNSASTKSKKHLAWADEIGNSLSTRVFFDADAAPSCRSDRVRG
jgi:hypothetical protein